MWPDAATTGDRVGVDALTHGLATLTNYTRRGNDHARWVKKFSLGNGPAEWVNEYNITKEGGKMLGTLVNLAITRMEGLESFSWDMPTGILRDVFMSLHDLNGTLKNLHVRFHDNRDTTPPTSQDASRRVESPTFKGFAGLRSLSVLDIDEPQYLTEMSHAVENSVATLKELRVGIAVHMVAVHRWIKEWDQLEPTSPEGSFNGVGGGVLGVLFSRIVTPPGRRQAWGNGRPAADSSVSGLAIAGNPADTPAAQAAQAAETPPAAPAFPATTAPTAAPVPTPVPTPTSTPTPTPTATPTPTPSTSDPNLASGSDPATAGDVPALPHIASAPDLAVPSGDSDLGDWTASLDGSFVEINPPTPPNLPAPAAVAQQQQQQPEAVDVVSMPAEARPTEATQLYEPDENFKAKQLRLETLALERVPISISVLVNTKAIDWTCLSSLTIINCFNHDRLWKALRRKFSPFPNPSLHSASLKQGGHSSPSATRARGTHPAPGLSDFKIRLKKLHTDCVTSQLITFIRDTLPPNSLEILFLQELSNDSTVTMESIYRGALRRHKGSLKKLLVNSEGREGAEGLFKWTFKREYLAFISSGKMPNLRELGLVLEYKDWVINQPPY